MNNELSIQLVGESFHFVQNHNNFRQQSKTKCKVDHGHTEKCGNLYHISDQRSRIPSWNKKKTLQLWEHSKRRLNVGNLSVH